MDYHLKVAILFWNQQIICLLWQSVFFLQFLSFGELLNYLQKEVTIIHEYFNYTKSDLYKLRHSGFLLIHILIPVLGAGLTMLYAAFSHTDNLNKLAAFFQILAIAFPFVISIICQIVVEPEAKAGHFQNILTLPNRKKSIISKLSILLLFGLLSTILCTVLFGLLFLTIDSQLRLSIVMLIKTSTILWGSNILLYATHLFLSFRFGKNFCIGVGVIGSLSAALLQTGLGTGLWYILPYGWGVHFSEYMLAKYFQLTATSDTDVKIGIILCIVATCVIIELLLLWFLRYEGKTETNWYVFP